MAIRLRVQLPAYRGTRTSATSQTQSSTPRIFLTAVRMTSAVSATQMGATNAARTPLRQTTHHLAKLAVSTISTALGAQILLARR